MELVKGLLCGSGLFSFVSCWRRKGICRRISRESHFLFIAKGMMRFFIFLLILLPIANKMVQSMSLRTTLWLYLCSVMLRNELTTLSVKMANLSQMAARY